MGAIAKRIQVISRPLLCLIQPRVSPGSTADKFRLCPRHRLFCLHLLTRPYSPFSRRGSFHLGLAVVEPPVVASLRPPWITVSIDRILLHLPSHDQPPPRKSRARLGAPRLIRLRLGPSSTQFLLCRFNTPPTRPHLLPLYLVPSLQRHLGVSAPQPASPRCRVSLCLSVCRSDCLAVCLSFFLPACLPACPPVCLPVRLSVSVCMCNISCFY